MIVVDDVDLATPLFSLKFPELAAIISDTRHFISPTELLKIANENNLELVFRRDFKVKNTHTSYSALFEKK